MPVIYAVDNVVFYIVDLASCRRVRPNYFPLMSEVHWTRGSPDSTSTRDEAVRMLGRASGDNREPTGRARKTSATCCRMTRPKITCSSSLAFGLHRTPRNSSRA